MIAAPYTSAAEDVARALHEDAHGDVSDETLTHEERVALVEWHLDNASAYGPDGDACQTFAEALARWAASEHYRRDLLAALTYPEPYGRLRDEVEAEIEREREIRSRRRRPAYLGTEDLAPVTPLPRGRRPARTFPEGHLAGVIPLHTRRTA